MERIAYTIDQATEVVPFSRSKLYELNKQGVLPFRKQGGRTYIRHEDLKAFIDNGELIQ